MNLFNLGLLLNHLARVYTKFGRCFGVYGNSILDFGFRSGRVLSQLRLGKCNPERAKLVFLDSGFVGRVFFLSSALH
jgi:hypothetical protein